MKLISSLVAVAVTAVSVNASAGLQKQKPIDINEDTSTLKNLVINTPANLVINTNNMVVVLGDTLASLPGSTQQKASAWLECMKNDFNEFKDYIGARAISVVGCSGESLVDGSLTVVRKVSAGVFQLVAIPGHMVDDIGDSLGADIPYIIESFDDKRNRGVAYLTTPVGLGYVIGAGSAALAAGGVGGAPGVGNVISFVADNSEGYNDMLKLVINKVDTGIRMTKRGSIYVVDATARTGIEVAKSTLYAVSDVIESAGDILQVPVAAYEDTSCGIAKGLRKGLGGIYDFANAARGKSMPKAQRAKCEINGVEDMGKNLVTAAIRLWTLPVRFLDRTIRQTIQSVKHQQLHPESEFQINKDDLFLSDDPETQAKQRQLQQEMNDERARNAM